MPYFVSLSRYSHHPRALGCPDELERAAKLVLGLYGGIDMDSPNFKSLLTEERLLPRHEANIAVEVVLKAPLTSFFSGGIRDCAFNQIRHSLSEYKPQLGGISLRTAVATDSTSIFGA
jgi:hypothetical protein